MTRAGFRDWPPETARFASRAGRISTSSIQAGSSRAQPSLSHHAYCTPLAHPLYQSLAFRAQLTPRRAVSSRSGAYAERDFPPQRPYARRLWSWGLNPMTTLLPLVSLEDQTGRAFPSRLASGETSITSSCSHMAATQLTRHAPSLLYEQPALYYCDVRCESYDGSSKLTADNLFFDGRAPRPPSDAFIDNQQQQRAPPGRRTAAMDGNDCA
jgi:hypothetical protein